MSSLFLSTTAPYVRTTRSTMNAAEMAATAHSTSSAKATRFELWRVSSMPTASALASFASIAIAVVMAEPRSRTAGDSSSSASFRAATKSFISRSCVIFAVT